MRKSYKWVRAYSYKLATIRAKERNLEIVGKRILRRFGRGRRRYYYKAIEKEKIVKKVVKKKVKEKEILLELNTCYMVVGGFDYKHSKYSGKDLQLELNIRIVTGGETNIEDIVSEIDRFVRVWFLTEFQGLDIDKLGWSIGVDERYATTETKDANLDYLDFNRPNWKDKLKRDLELFLSDLEI